MNDINMLDYTVFLLALVAADTAMALSLVILSRGVSGRLSVRNNVSNYSSYLIKCKPLVFRLDGMGYPLGAVSLVLSYNYRNLSMLRSWKFNELPMDVYIIKLRIITRKDNQNYNLETSIVWFR